MVDQTRSPTFRASPLSGSTPGLIVAVLLVAVLGLAWLQLPEIAENTAAGRLIVLTSMLAVLCALLGVLWLRERLESEKQSRLLASERAALEQLLAIFDGAQQLSRCASWISDRSGNLTWVSQQYLDMLSVTVETCPRTIPDFIARFVDDPAQAEESRANAVKHSAGEPTEGTRRLRLPDGTIRWIMFRNIPRVDNRGLAIGSLGIGRDITEERAAFADLATRTSTLETAKQIAGLGTWTWYADGDVLVTCDYMKRIYGTTDANHPRSMREWALRFMPPEDFEEFVPVLADCFGGKPFDRERRLHTADGMQKWIRSIAEPVFDSTGRLSHYCGVTLDITPQKQALLELARRTEQLEEAQTIGRMGSWYWHPATDRLEISAQYRHIFEVDADTDVVSLADWIDRYYHPDEKADTWDSKRRAAAGETLEAQRRIRTAKGNERWIDTICHPVCDNHGRVVAVSGVTRDITDEKARELRLIETTRQLSEAHRIAEMGHFYWDIETDRLYGFGDHDAPYEMTLDQSITTMSEWQRRWCHPEERDLALRNREHLLQGKPYSVQRRILTAAGETRWLAIIGEPVHDNNGKLVAFRGVTRNITAQKVAELQLQESEEKFRLISENMHDQVALHDRDGAILYCSPSTERLMGYSVADSIGRTPYDFIHPDDLGRVRAAVNQFANTPRAAPLTLEYRFRHRAGHYMWLETVVVPVRDASGTLRHFQATSRDVTERRMAEERLRFSEERFRALTEISSDWYWETDAAHRMAFISRARTVRSNLPRSAVLGRTRWELFPNAMSEEEWAAHRARLEARQPFQALITRIFDAESGEVSGYFSISGSPMFDAEGQFTGYRGTGRDITRIKLAERALAEKEERYRLITQNMQDLISLHSPDGRVLFVSPSFTTLTGHGVERVLNRTPLRLLHPEDLHWCSRRFLSLMSGREVPAALTYRLRHRDGYYLWLESQISMVRDVQGRLLHAQVASRDVTDRRNAELAVERKTRELARANRQLEVEVQQRQELERNILMTIELELAQVGLELHDELGQDLTGVALLTKSLERRLVEKHPEFAADAGRISELVNRTIRHTRMISHGLSPYIWGSDGLVAALIQLANDVDSLGVVDCRTKIDPDISIRDEIVARSLYRIAQESTNNALKHSRAQTITLSLTQRGQGVQLLIQDDGVGGTGVELPANGEGSSRFHSIRHRCSAIGAALTVRHGRHGGTSIKVRWQPNTQLSHDPSVTRQEVF